MTEVRGEFGESQWSTLGKAKLKNGSLLLQDDGDSTDVPFLITKQEFAPNNGPLTIVADIRFTDISPEWRSHVRRLDPQCK